MRLGTKTLRLGIAALAACAAAVNGQTLTLLDEDENGSIALDDGSLHVAGGVARATYLMLMSDSQDVEFTDGATVRTKSVRFTAEVNCKTYEMRVTGQAALRDGDLSLVREENIESHWQPAPWELWKSTRYACAASERQRDYKVSSYPNVAALAADLPRLADERRARRDARALRAAASAANDSSASDRPTSGVLLDGIDLADCATAERRQLAAADVPPDKVHYQAYMAPAERQHAALQFVLQTCAIAKLLSGEDPFAQPDLIPTHSWYALDFADCKAAWNGDCRKSYSATVRDGYQICRQIHVEDARGDKAEVIVTPSGWLPGGGARPKFTEYLFELHSNGGYHILDHQSANIKVSDLWITYISDKLDDAQRRKRGCDMPARPVPPPPRKPPAPAALVSAIISFSPTAAVDRFAYIVRNPGGGQSTTHYILEAYDTFYRAWRPHIDLIRQQGPGDSWEEEVHRYDAVCWRFRSEIMTSAGWQPAARYNTPCAW